MKLGNKIESILTEDPNRLHIIKVHSSASNWTSYYKVFLVDNDYSILNITWCIATRAKLNYSNKHEAISVKGCNYCKQDWIIDCIWDSLDLKSAKPHYPSYIIGD